MVSMRLGNSVPAMLLAGVLSMGGYAAHAASDGQWAERVQIVYDPDTKGVARIRLRVWDMQPEKGLEFLWEPEKDSYLALGAADGVIEGSGKLVWRVRGSAAHDRRAIHSTYHGEMKDGRPHGHGRLEERDGQYFEGQWVAGVLHGQATHQDALGNRYSGNFEHGKPHGSGRMAMIDGSIYTGEFRNGLRHGEGRIRLPGGTEYAARWISGQEVAGSRPDVMADAMIGGLLRAQASGGDAGKVTFSATVDTRMTQQSTLQYAHEILDERIEIYPSNDGLRELWNGTFLIGPYSLFYGLDEIDWSKAFAFMQVEFRTEDNSRVKLDSMELQVEDSQTYRKPFLRTRIHQGCVGYRPDFSFMNEGWGPAQNAKITNFEFFKYGDESEPVQVAGEIDVGEIDMGTAVSIEPLLQTAGVDTNALKDQRFSCSSGDMIEQCRNEIVTENLFGKLSGLVDGDGGLFVQMKGTVSYSWQDDRGGSHQESEVFDVPVQLAFIESDLTLAEFGGGWGMAPEALRYIDVELADDRQNYVIDLPVRGNKNLSTYTARVKLSAEKSTIHNFRAAARFADGSERYSKPISLFYMKPRPVDYTVPKPDGCYITQDFDYD